jgi:hypothetical protein
VQIVFSAAVKAHVLTTSIGTNFTRAYLRKAAEHVKSINGNGNIGDERLL